MSKTVQIIGVGRSGTKLLQMLVAYIMADQGGNVNFNYEPLLWEDYRLKKINPTGISVHKSLPLLLKKPYKLSPKQQLFFSQFGNIDGINSVTKFIRMTGRLPVIHDFYHNGNIIFIYRHPVGVVNSILNLGFSLLGPPHYESDFPRLIEEAKSQRVISQRQIDMVNSYRWGKEAIYWYVLNKKAVRDLAGGDALVLSFDYIVKNKERCIRSLCNYLRLKYKPEYNQLFDIPGYNIRYIDQLLVPSEFENRNKCFRFIEDWTRRAIGRSKPMFTSVRKLTDAPILSIPTKNHPKKEQLTVEEEILVEQLCKDVLLELDKLQNDND